MSATEKQILSLVSTLSTAERIRIMQAILSSLEEQSSHEPEVSQNNLNIALERSEAFDKGLGKPMSREEFWENLKNRNTG